MFGTILENVVLDPLTRKVQFEDQSITENTRASYPLHYIPNYVPSGRGGHPKNIVFLTADAFGVLPPDRAAHARAGDVLLPLRLHGEGRRHGARREGAAGDVLVVLRRGVPRLAPDASTPRCSASCIDEHGAQRVARQHRLERRRRTASASA